MRNEIKFRAWDKYFNKMREVECINFLQQCVWLKTEGLDITIRHMNDVELMQHTGLKDRNGREIYEGDILLYNNHIKTVVAYKNAAYVRSCGNGNAYLLYDSFIENGVMIDFEVIGNIYENPDLLEEE